MKNVIKEFIGSLKRHYPEIKITINDIEYEFMASPHNSPRLPKEKCAVYIFTFTYDYYIESLRGCVLKVGKAGLNSAPRFQNQHYINNSTGSTVAKSIENNPILWDVLGIKWEECNKTTKCEDPGQWLRNSTDRHHFYINANLESSDKVLTLLEVYLRGIWGSLLEGTATCR